MKVAITVFKNGVSPRLDIAERLLIYEIHEGGVTKKEECRLAFDEPGQLISTLQKNGITRVICGGCPQFLLRMLSFHGLEVLSGFTGDPGRIVKQLMDGKLKDFPSCAPFGYCLRKRNRWGKIKKEV
ncbi:MAG: hypothetical protein GY950_05900 [bacterium]|nr:hypothetical protein [bacterium]